jgi:hypothetical protein
MCSRVSFNTGWTATAAHPAELLRLVLDNAAIAHLWDPLSISGTQYKIEIVYNCRDAMWLQRVIRGGLSSPDLLRRRREVLA